MFINDFCSFFLSLLDQAQAGSCGCPGYSDECEQNCIKQNPGKDNVKGACKGFLYLYCKCTVDGGDWYSIGGSC